MLGIFLEYETQRIYDALNDIETQQSGQETSEIIRTDHAAPSMMRTFLKLGFQLVLLGICFMLG